MAEYLCAGVGCDDYVAEAATWFDDRGRYVGRTCATCEQRWLHELTEHELADLARDPFLSGATLRRLAERGAPAVDAALRARGRLALPPSLGRALQVMALHPIAPLEPFWRRYRDDAGEAFDSEVVEAEIIDIELFEGDIIDAELVDA